MMGSASAKEYGALVRHLGISNPALPPTHIEDNAPAIDAPLFKDQDEQKVVAEKPEKAKLAANPTISPQETGKEKEAEGIEDFGEKIGGARKDQKYSSTREISDDEIVNLPLSKIWPKEEIDNTEDHFIAAFSTAARAEIPNKPRQGYKLARWVDAVKLFRRVNGILLDKSREGGDVRKLVIDRIKEDYPSLKKLLHKVYLLEGIPREHWGRNRRCRCPPRRLSVWREWGEDRFSISLRIHRRQIPAV